MIFAIELLSGRDPKSSRVMDRFTADEASVQEAARLAKAALDAARLRFPDRSPDGCRIRDEEGEVTATIWDRP
jgi:hypothetical protein